MDRREFLYSNINKESKILEFGPYYSPIYPKKDGYRTETVDAFSKDVLIEIAKNNPVIQDYSAIEEVDYVCTHNYAEFIGKRRYYDLIAASHVIEHTTDIISFLTDCSTLLDDEGIIRLIIPDKRYSFDTFKEVTSTRAVIDQHKYRKNATVHSLGTIVEQKMRACVVESGNTYMPNSAFFYMKEKMILPELDSESIIGGLRTNIQTFSEDEYIDVHSWIVTPKTFEIMIYELNELGYIDLVVDRIYTRPRCVEFYVQLRKGQIESDNVSKRLSLYIDRKNEAMEEFEDAIECRKLIASLKHDTRVYIYGTGQGTKRIFEILMYLNVDYDAHVVSDGYKTEELFNEHPVLEFSEIKSRKNIVILIGVEREDIKKDILNTIREYDIDCFFA